MGKEEEVVQAVILADSFNAKFRPITFEEPKSLLPLVNIPILAYQLECLAACGVQEVFVFCCSNADKIIDFLKTSGWFNSHTPRVQTILQTDACFTEGDALRTICDHAEKGSIRGDFILLRSGVICNMDLLKALNVHKARREENKDSIMTMVLQKASRANRTRNVEEDLIIVLDEETHEIIHYRHQLDDALLDMGVIQHRPSIVVQTDLMDCRVDICSVEVLFLMKDNFDYKDVREDWLTTGLNDEVLQHQVHAYFVTKDEYAACVTSFQTYDSVTKDVLRRWMYPIVPDNNFCGTSYVYSRPHIYKEGDVRLTRTCEIGECTAIGSGSVIGEGSSVTSSVLGRNCTIGNNVVIESSILFDGVVVGDGARVSYSILCTEAQVGKASVISKGCLLSYKVVIGPSVVVPAFTKFTRLPPSATVEEDDDFSDDESQEEEALEWSESEVGVGGEGRVYLPPEGEDKVQYSIAPDYRGVLELRQAQPLLSESDESDSDDDFVGVQGESIFEKEAYDTALEGMREGHSVDNIALEINGLKFAENKSFFDCARQIMTAILALVDLTGDMTIAVKELQDRLTKWKGLLLKFLQSEKDEVDLIMFLEHYSQSKEGLERVFQHLIHKMYDLDVVSEEAISTWESADSEFVAKCDKFLQWLREAEEEESDSEEDETETDSSDEE